MIRKDLGPNQLQWCRQNIPHFDEAYTDVIKAKAEEKANRDEMRAKNA